MRRRDLIMGSGAALAGAALGELLAPDDLGVIHQVAGRVIVLRDGVTREAGPTSTVLQQPADDYTRLLVAAARRGYANLPDVQPALAAG